MVDVHQPKRSIEISGSLTLADAGVGERLSTLEEKLKSLVSEKSKPSWLGDILKSIIPSAVLAGIGYFLNDTVNRALKEREMQIDVVKDMQALSTELQKSDIQRTEAFATAAQLASYGKYSVPFFINVQEVGNEYGDLGAVEGLRMVARTEPAAVCEQVGAVIRNHTGLYRWQSHLAAFQLIGEVHCSSESASVRAYRSELTSLDVLKKWVGGPAPEQSELDKLSAEAATAAARLDQVVPAPPSRWFQHTP